MFVRTAYLHCAVVWLQLLLICAHVSALQTKNYTDHAIVRISNENLHLLLNDHNDAKSPEESNEVLWLDSSDNNTHAYVRVSPSHARRIRSAPLNKRHFKVVTDSLQKWLDAEGDLKTDGSDMLGMSVFESVLVPTYSLDRYHPLNQVYQYLQLISKLDRVRVSDIGVSHEGRAVKAVEIINNPSDPYFIWIDGLTHAREWVTVTTAIYIIEQAISSGIRQNFIIVPIINVDGYEYTWNVDRLWRKNRRPYGASSLTSVMPDRCNGVDLNRNYDMNFGGEGASNNPCSNLYGGPSAFSEPEVRAVAELLWKMRNKIKLSVSLHSFNQLWACPYAFTKEASIHYNHHMNVLRDVQSAVYNTNGVKYQIGPLSTSLYVGSGFMMDWIYSKLGIVDSYLAELRDRGMHGFVLPVDQIMPTATETWNGLTAAIRRLFNY